jgi:hypothetical protein
MSANKTIKALHQERAKLYGEIRRLKAVAGEPLTISEMTRDARIAVSVDLPALPKLESVPTLMRFTVGHGEEATFLEGASQDYYLKFPVSPNNAEPPLLMTGTINFHDLPPVIEDEPAIDWSKAPEGATHRNGPNGLWYKFDLEANTASFWINSGSGWMDSSPASDYEAGGEVSEMIARPVQPEEVWSLNGSDNSWSYSSLAELVRDCYGHGADSVGPMGDDGSLQVGDTVHRGIKHFDDPADWVPDADYVANHMYEQAQGSDAGEWADNYPDLDKAAEAALEVALEPLKAWARKHAQPTFFTVEKATTHVLTAEDVLAAMAQEAAK